jgi:LPS sulfotransferase NodH/capsular polysaccharide biosynthesis protein
VSPVSRAPIVIPPGIDLRRDPHAVAFDAQLPLRDGDRVELPDGVRFVFIVFTNRSGSTFLSELLASTGFFNYAHEFLNEETVIPSCRTNGWDSLSRYVAGMARAHGKNGYFVTKASIGQMAILAQHGLLDRIVQHSHFLVVERADKLAQVVSWFIAKQTRLFTSYHQAEAPVEPVYKGAGIRKNLDDFIQGHANISAFMALNGLCPFHVTYETLTAHPQRVGAWVCAHLGRPELVCDPGRIGIRRQATALNAEWRARFLEEALPAPAPSPASREPPVRQYRRMTLREIAGDRKFMLRGSSRVMPLDYLPAARLEIPPLTWGDTDLPRAQTREPVAQGAAGASLQLAAVPAWLLRRVLVHGKYGILTLDDAAVSETLEHAPFHKMPGAKSVGTDAVDLPDLPRTDTVFAAFHLLACNQDNYYHWLIDAMSRFSQRAYERAAAAPHAVPGTLLLAPQADTSWKGETLNACVPETIPRVSLHEEARVFAQRLIYVPNLSGSGFSPHPALLAFYDRVRNMVLGDDASKGRPWRRLFVSRADSTNRVLVNEAEVAAVAEAAGFTKVVLTGQPLAAQVRLFAEASHIIAPHGAALVNIGFCAPGATMCELHMDRYVHWSFRRLAALRGVRYGCLIGEAIPPFHDWTHSNRWRLDPAALQTLLAGQGFLNE